MKKILLLVAAMAAISLGCSAHELIHQDVTIDIKNRSGEEVTVRDQDNNEVTLGDKEDREGTFKLHQPEKRLLRAFHFNDYSTELEVRGEGTGTKKIPVKGSNRRTLTIKPDLKCDLSGKDGGSSKKRSRDEDQDEDQDRKGKKGKTDRDEERDENQDEEESQQEPKHHHHGLFHRHDDDSN